MTLLFALPGDRSGLQAAIATPGGLAALDPRGRAHLERAMASLDAITLISMAETASPADAVTLYRVWLAARPPAVENALIWYNFGAAALRVGDPAAAVPAFRAALQHRPDLTEAAINLGTALEALGQPDAALATWRAALPAAPMRCILHNQLGRLMEDQGSLAAAAEELRASLLIDPAQPDVQQHLIHLRQRMAAWPVTELAIPGLDEAVAARHAGPLAALALTDDPLEQAATAANWIARKNPTAPGRLSPEQGYHHDRIRVGYLSSDFCRHAMSFLIAEMLELHDRDGFEVFGYCASPEDGSDIRARVTAALDHHVPIGAMSDLEAATRIRADEIDLLIDLNGLTKGARVGVLRWKPAPVQITYLGYIGPIPLPELDYILCDAVTIPPGDDALYQPKPLRIEGCYQANDSRPPLPVAVNRVEEGLPVGAFVYCCVSHHYKITEALFDGWCRILLATPGAVLWLIDDNAESRAALSARWLARGLAAERLIFAPRVSPERYRARLALADLFLDTFPYNAGTIASDALRMGLPLLTLQGRAFAARMAASLLTAIGLEECIATDLDDYVAKAVTIGREPARLARLKAHLAGDRWSRTLGDSHSFTRRIEAAYRSVVRRP